MYGWIDWLKWFCEVYIFLVFEIGWIHCKCPNGEQRKCFDFRRYQFKDFVSIDGFGLFFLSFECMCASVWISTMYKYVVAEEFYLRIKTKSGWLYGKTGSIYLRFDVLIYFVHIQNHLLFFNGTRRGLIENLLSTIMLISNIRFNILETLSHCLTCR